MREAVPFRRRIFGLMVIIIMVIITEFGKLSGKGGLRDDSLQENIMVLPRETILRNDGTFLSKIVSSQRSHNIVLRDIEMTSFGDVLSF